MDPIIVIICIVLALLGGLALGWFVSAKSRESSLESAKLNAADLKRTLDGVNDELKEVKGHYAKVRDDREMLSSKLAANEAAQVERDRAQDEKIVVLQEFNEKARQQLADQFSSVGNKLLDEAQRKFLERAEQKLGEQGNKSEAKIKQILQPVETTLKRYEDNLGRIEKEREGSYRALSQAVNQLTQDNQNVIKETQRLANVMGSSPKARGRWGEEQLRNILESAGLAENIDFSLQTSVTDEDSILRPDCVVNLPGNRCIVIDVKCPLVAFEKAFDEEDDALRQGYLKEHADAMKSYANSLGRKAYWQKFDLSPEFVIMFIPGEHFLSAAAERAPDLIETAYRNGVVIASTINMLALSKVMAGMWRQETLESQAKEVAEVGKELYKRLYTMGEHVAKLGTNLNRATGSYNDFVGSLETKVLTQAKRFEEMKIDTGGKSIKPLPTSEKTVRPLTKLPLASVSDSSKISEKDGRALKDEIAE